MSGNDLLNCMREDTILTMRGEKMKWADVVKVIIILAMFAIMYEVGFVYGYKSGYKIGIDSCDPMLNGEWFNPFSVDSRGYIKSDNFTHEVNP